MGWVFRCLSRHDCLLAHVQDHPVEQHLRVLHPGAQLVHAYRICRSFSVQPPPLCSAPPSVQGPPLCTGPFCAPPQGLRSLPSSRSLKMSQDSSRFPFRTSTRAASGGSVPRSPVVFHFSFFTPPRLFQTPGPPTCREIKNAPPRARFCQLLSMPPPAGPWR